MSTAATVRRSSISRRGLLAAGGALALTGTRGRVLAQESSPAAGVWSFTDDIGVTVTLPQRPARIVADLNAAAPLWDFGIRPVAVSGWTVSSDASWGNVDRSTPVINAQDGAPEPDLESLLELEADLFVTIAWGPDDIWSFTSPEAYVTTQSVVRVVVLSVAGLASSNLKRFVELSAALGIDLDAPELIQARQHSKRPSRHSQRQLRRKRTSRRCSARSRPARMNGMSRFRPIGRISPGISRSA